MYCSYNLSVYVVTSCQKILPGYQRRQKPFLTSIYHYEDFFILPIGVTQAYNDKPCIRSYMYMMRHKHFDTRRRNRPRRLGVALKSQLYLQLYQNLVAFKPIERDLLLYFTRNFYSQLKSIVIRAKRIISIMEDSYKANIRKHYSK